MYTDTTSIRALSLRDHLLVFGGSNGKYGSLEVDRMITATDGTQVLSDEIIKKVGTLDFNGKKLATRAVAQTTDYYFVLTVESPAFLYRIAKVDGAVQLVYNDAHPKAFYDAMTFWNDMEGIAMGDSVEDCLTVIITRDGGETWEKISCDNFPKSREGEGAFAASDTNIKIIGDNAWIISGGGTSRVYHSADKGRTWTVFETPVLQNEPTQGAYTVDFYDAAQGIIYGGDYTKPEDNVANIATTVNGGKSWQLTASGANDGFKSCVRYVPNSGGKEIIALGFTGISYSKDSGNTWSTISDEALLSFRFANDTVAYASGRNKIVKLTFR